MSKESQARPASRANVLIVDDNPDFRELLRVMLHEDYPVIEAADAEGALRSVETEDPDVVLLDLMLGDGPDGFFVLERLQQSEPELPVVILSQDQNTDSIVRAMKAGACHYIGKPPRQDELVERVRIALRDRHRSFALESHRLPGSPEIVGESPAIKQVRKATQAAARSDIPVLLLGETGTGKGLAARCVHEWGPRRGQSYKDVNVAGLAMTVLDSELFGHERGAFTGADRRHRGLFELASGGTLLLDEIGDLPPECQVKLLKVVEEGKFRRVGAETDLQTDVRIIAATHRDLEQMITDKTFRRDLYHRLAGFVIEIPPLRTRPEDIAPLARSFLDESLGLTDAALETLCRRPWAGNVRELQLTLRRASTLAGGKRIDVEDLSPVLSGSVPVMQEGRESDLLNLPYAAASREVKDRFRRRYVEHLLGRCGRNVSLAARESGMSRTHLHALIAELGLSENPAKSGS